MAGHNIAVYGIYPTETALDEGIEALREAGFRREDVSVLSPENKGNKDLTHKKASKAPEGASVGAGAGAVIGGLVAWLVAAGIVTIPGLGRFTAAGPVLAALAGAGAGGLMGGAAGAVIGLGVPEYEAKRYEGRIRSGGILISIHCDNSQWADKARSLLKETGAQEVSSSGEASADFAVGDKPLPRHRVQAESRLRS